MTAEQIAKGIAIFVFAVFVVIAVVVYIRNAVGRKLDKGETVLKNNGR